MTESNTEQTELTNQADIDAHWMRIAMQEAQKAEAIGEVPVGAIVVKDNQLLAAGYNQVITSHDPSAHAEVVAIRAAGKSVQNYRLIDCTLYVTLEPCPMCCGALVHARFKRVVFGAADYKTGAMGSVMELAKHESMNHQLEMQGGVLAEECAAMISAFFQKRREEKKKLKQAKRLEQSSPSTNEE